MCILCNWVRMGTLCVPPPDAGYARPGKVSGLTLRQDARANDATAVEAHSPAAGGVFHTRIRFLDFPVLEEPALCAVRAGEARSEGARAGRWDGRSVEIGRWWTGRTATGAARDGALPGGRGSAGEARYRARLPGAFCSHVGGTDRPVRPQRAESVLSGGNPVRSSWGVRGVRRRGAGAPGRQIVRSGTLIASPFRGPTDSPARRGRRRYDPASMISPNNTQVLPSHFSSRIPFSGRWSVGLVFAMMPGSIVGSTTS